jgi:two-component system, cell cycle sensor histidine kinase and response regulator CckA
MLQGPGSDATKGFDKSKHSRAGARRVALVFLSTLALFTLYEALRDFVLPGIPAWGSRLAAIALIAAATAAGSFFALRNLCLRDDSLQQLVRTSPEPVWVHQNSVILMANSACAAVFGVASPDELLGKNVFDFVHPEVRDIVRQRMQSRLRGSDPGRQIERRLVRADGSEINLEVVICTIPYKGHPASFVLFHDIAQRAEAEQRLRESEANLAAAQRIAHLGSWTADLDANGQVDESAVRWSDEIYRVLGYEVGQIDANRSNFFRGVHPEDVPRIQETLAKVLGERAGASVEYRILHPDGSVRHIQGHVNIVCDERTGKRLRLVGTVQDLTERKQAEEALAQLALIVESSDDAISSVALDGKIVSWNKGAQRIYGYSESEALGQSIGIISPPDRPQEIPQLLERLRRGERIPAFETVRVRKDGQPIDVSLTISPVFDHGGKIVGTAAVARDNTARKREEERSRRLAQVVDSATELISTGDPEGRITFMNRAFLQAIGWSEEEVLGKYFRDVVLSPNNSPELREEIRTGIMERDGWKGECLHCRKDGSDFPVYLSVGHLRDRHGRAIGNVGIVRDLTESKLAEERFYKAFHLNPEPITLATLSDGRYLDVNESFLRSTGYSREDVIGRTSMELKFWERLEDRARLIEALQKHGSVRDLEITFRTKTGAQRTALDSADVIEINGQTCVIAILKDITERKALEKQLRQLQKMEAVGQLSGGIAHDFNNLLGVILGYSELLEAGLDRTDKLHKTALEIKKAGQRAASLTRQLLAFSRQQVLEARVLNLNAVVGDTAKMLRRLIGEHIQVITLLASDLGQIKADQGQIEQVIINLAVNSRDAMPEGGKITIETRNIELDEAYAHRHPATVAGKYIELAVTDNGVGMDAQTQSHIFEPFFTTKELGKGTGLGLATVYGVVKQSGGCVWVYSELGIGTTFKVYLPRVDAALQPSPRVNTEKALARGSETILLVEDEASLRTLTRTMLEQNGYTVLEAGGGEEAMEVARRADCHIDLLLTDMVMPGMNGRAVAYNLSRIRPEVKVLYMSGYSGFSSREPAESGDPLLAKPFTRDTLLRKLDEVLHLQKAPVA